MKRAWVRIIARVLILISYLPVIVVIGFFAGLDLQFLFFPFFGAFLILLSLRDKSGRMIVTKENLNRHGKVFLVPLDFADTIAESWKYSK